MEPLPPGQPIHGRRCDHWTIGFALVAMMAQGTIHICLKHLLDWPQQSVLLSGYLKDDIYANVLHELLNFPYARLSYVQNVLLRKFVLIRLPTPNSAIPFDDAEADSGNPGDRARLLRCVLLVRPRGEVESPARADADAAVRPAGDACSRRWSAPGLSTADADSGSPGDRARLLRCVHLLRPRGYVGLVGPRDTGEAGDAPGSSGDEGDVSSSGGDVGDEVYVGTIERMGEVCAAPGAPSQL